MPGAAARESLPTTALAPPGAGGPSAGAAASGAQRGNTLLVVAGVGVLLLAMGVGVLIGRSGSGKQSVGPAQVISVAQAPSSTAGTGAAASTQASFVADWPAGTSGYTVQLQSLPVAGTALSAVEAAKAVASAKGAKAVGALKSEEFASLSPGSYVIYSGVDPNKREAEKTLASLKKSFPAAKLLRIATSAGASSSAGTSGSSKSGGVGSSETKPAPPTVLETLKNTKGKNYEEKSKALPNVVSTG